LSKTPAPLCRSWRKSKYLHYEKYKTTHPSGCGVPCKYTTNFNMLYQL
jgi:hypothetical protein